MERAAEVVQACMKFFMVGWHAHAKPREAFQLHLNIM
jgi:hypothetical protein